MALCLLYLRVLRVSLNQEPLWQHLSAVCSQCRSVRPSPLVSAEDPRFLRCFFPDRSGAAKLPYCWNTQRGRIGCSAPSKAPPSRRCVLDARESLDFLMFSTRNSAEYQHLPGRGRGNPLTALSEGTAGKPLLPSRVPWSPPCVRFFLLEPATCWLVKVVWGLGGWQRFNRPSSWVKV